MSTFLEKPAVVKTRGMVQAVAPFFVFLPYIAGFITLLTAVLGPAMIPNRNLSLLTITALPGVAQDPDSHAGIWFGQFSACIQAPGAKVECTPSSLTPDYQSILDKALEAGLPQSMLPFLPDHIIQTPTVMVVGLVFMFAALPLLLVASLAAWAPQLRIRMSLQVSHWMWWSAMWILFWGWLLCLSISLAQNNQFDHYGESFRAVARVTTKNVTIEGFKHAKLGGSFLQQWIGHAFVTICIPWVYAQSLSWPEEEGGSDGSSWLNAKA